MTVAEFFPRRKREDAQYVDHYCHYDEALKRHMVCSEFYFAKVKNAVIPNRALGTWVLAESVPRDMSWAAKYYASERGNYEDHSGEPFSLWDCPFCGGDTEPIPMPRIA